jgi:LuxR family transcriptional regulator, maltose regulon positive regulatory protein
MWSITGNAALLKTKTRVPPPRSRHVSRARLTALLDEATRRPLTIISAPAGFGKSTVVSEWIHGRRDRRVAWLSLDEDDNDISRFLLYLIAALQPLEPGIGRSALSLLGALQTPPPADLVTQLLNEASELAAPLIIVLDDYHLIRDAEIDAALVYAIDHLPPQLRLAVLTRSEPRFPLPRWRALERVIELEASDLRFSNEESALFLTRTMELALDPGTAQALTVRTEGWVAGLQLAALSLTAQIRAEGDDAIKPYVEKFSGGHRFIADYLDEIIGQQTTEMQLFLKQSAVLDRLCPSLCEAVTDFQDCQGILARLEQSNLFLVRLDDHRYWYRYHQLFLDYLRAGPALNGKRELHLKAKNWYERHGFGREAVKHALLAQDTPEALRLVRSNTEALLCGGEFSTILSWLETLPESTILENGDLSGFKAWILYLRGRIRESEAYAALALSAQTESTPSALRCTLAAFQAFLALNRGDARRAIPFAKEALVSFGNEPSFFRLRALGLLGHAQRQSGDQLAASVTLREAVELGRQHGNELTTLDALAALTSLMYAQGHLREAMHLCNEAIHTNIDTRHKPLPVAGLAYVPRGVLHYQMDQLRAAHDDLIAGISLCEQLGMVPFALLGQRNLARVHHACGNRDAAWDTLAAASQLAARSEDPRRKRLVDVVAADLNLREGNLEAAASSLERLQRCKEPPTEYERVVYARLCLRRRESRKAESILLQLERATEQAQRFGSLIAVHILQALCKQQLGDHSGALKRLERAVRRAAPENYRRVFIDEGPEARVLLANLRGVATQFVSSLIAAFDAAGLVGVRLEELSAELQISRTQLKILSLLATGLTNEEIARELSITVGTTKWHLNQIFSRLEVRNRTEAVNAARRLGVVP